MLSADCAGQREDSTFCWWRRFLGGGGLGKFVAYFNVKGGFFDGDYEKIGGFVECKGIVCDRRAG